MFNFQSSDNLKIFFKFPSSKNTFKKFTKPILQAKFNQKDKKKEPTFQQTPHFQNMKLQASQGHKRLKVLIAP